MSGAAEAHATAQHRYVYYLREDDPRSQQPTRIRTPLKPHQAAALERARRQENGPIFYEIPPLPTGPAPGLRYNNGGPYFQPFGATQFESNIGIMGDAPSYGKTLIALAIIADNPLSQIYTLRERSFNTFGHGQTSAIRMTMDIRASLRGPEHFFETTLVVVPHGPVYFQWIKNAEQHTTLKFLALDSIGAIRAKCPAPGTPFVELKAFFDQYDFVLIKETTIKTLMNHYDRSVNEVHPIHSWARIMIDEAHDILRRIPTYNYRFVWLISATHSGLQREIYGGRSGICTSLRDGVQGMWMSMQIIRGELGFVQQSFNIPPIQEFQYICHIAREMAVIHAFLTPQVLDCVNSGDMRGAITLLGGSAETESSLADLVSAELRREIANMDRRIEYTTGLIFPAAQEAQKTARIEALTVERARLQERLDSLIERITNLPDKECEICREPLVNPIYLECTHVYCAECLMGWLRMQQTSKTCPTCRVPIQRDKLRIVVDGPSPPAPSAPAPRNTTTTQQVSKLDQLMQIIEANPAGRFLVFSKMDRSFDELRQRLSAAGISAAEMKGAAVSMMASLRGFQENRVRVILLNTNYAGSGIEITCATDVILMHSMGDNAIQAIGRANRVGRTESLRVHHLLYPHEINIA